MDDPKWRQVYSECETAFSIARRLWENKNTSPEALQATFATVLIHSKGVASHPQAGRESPVSSGRPAPSPAAPTGSGGVPACPVCHGEMYDNRQNKKTPKSPDFRCKSKTCKDEKGFTPGVWEKDLKKSGYVAAAKGSATNFQDLPEALEEDEKLPWE